jgi:hypothetical protein
MRNNVVMLASAFVLGLAVVAAVPAAPAADAAAIDKLIAQLSSEDFDTRNQATKSLDAIGEPALDALRKAAETNADPEVRMRSATLVRLIEQRAASSSFLKPQRVRLVYKDTPVPDAVADFVKKTGYQIVLSDPENKLNERKITLDTGDVPFWEAFDQFCEKANLVEAEGNVIRVRPPIRRGPAIQPGPGAQGQAPAAQQAVAQVQVQIQIQAQPAVLPPNGPGGVVIVGGPGVIGNGVSGQIVLTDGTPKTLPTDASSSVRIRALDNNNFFGAAQPNEYLITLQATPEPRLQMYGVQTVTIKKAIDDQGQALMQAVGEMENPQIGQPGLVQPGVIRPGIGRVPVWNGGNQYAAVRLKQGAKASKVLKELSGVLTAQVVTEAKAVITVDDVLKSAGKTFKGEDGYIKVVEVSKAGDDQLILRIEMQQPRDLIPAQLNPQPLNPVPVPNPLPRGALPAQAQALPAQAQVQIAQPVGGVAIAPQPAIARLPGNGLALLDEKGNALPMAGQQQTAARADGKGGVIVEQTLTFQTKGMGMPSKFVLAGSHTATVSIPFTLKNVTLP